MDKDQKVIQTFIDSQRGKNLRTGIINFSNRGRPAAWGSFRWAFSFAQPYPRFGAVQQGLVHSHDLIPRIGPQSWS